MVQNYVSLYEWHVGNFRRGLKTLRQQCNLIYDFEELEFVRL